MPLRVEPRRDRKLNRFLKAAEVRALRRGRTLHEAGASPRHIFLVRTGYLRLVAPATPSANARMRTVAVAGPWEVLGGERIGQGVEIHRCVAGEDCTYQALDGAAVLQAIKTTQKTFAALLDGLARDLDCARRLAGGSGSLPARGRLALVVMDLARRWGEPKGKGILLGHWLPHQVLADLAGAHRSTATTALNEWFYEGVLREAPRGLLVSDPEGLSRVADSRAGEPVPR